MILVTGGAGFIGSHIVELLIADGHEVRVLDMLLPSAHRERPEIHPDAEFIEGDVRDAAVLAGALADVDAVCHQAAMVGLGADILDLPDYVSHNDLGTAVLLGELARRRFDGRVVLASSMVVYGEGRYRCARHGLVSPGPRELQALAAGQFEVACPDLRRRAGARVGPGDGAARSAQRLRGDQASSGASRRRVLTRDRCAGHGAALPQRLRAADAA